MPCAEYIKYLLSYILVWDVGIMLLMKNLYKIYKKIATMTCQNPDVYVVCKTFYYHKEYISQNWQKVMVFLLHIAQGMQNA